MGDSCIDGSAPALFGAGRTFETRLAARWAPPHCQGPWMSHCHANQLNKLWPSQSPVLNHRPKQYYISLGRSVRLPAAGALETETHPSAGRGGPADWTPGRAPGRTAGRASGAFVTSLLSVEVSVESSEESSVVESSPSSARFRGSSGDGGRGGVSGRQSEAQDHIS